MTEAEWLASTDPRAMLALLTGKVPGNRMNGLHCPTQRQLRLFACAWWRSLPPHTPDHEARTVRAEQGTNRAGDYGFEDMLRQMLARDQGTWEDETGRVLTFVGAALLREIVGNPFQPWVVAHPTDRRALREYQIFNLDWLTPTVLALAQAAYDERLSDGPLDPDRLVILADALEDAGCTDEAILRHLRGWERCFGCHRDDARYMSTQGCTVCGNRGWRKLRAPHVRGCWALDLILGKE